MGNQRVHWLWKNMNYWVKVQTWIGNMNLSGTTHLKLESRPAFRNFPDSANLEDKKGTLWVAAASPFVCIHVRFLRNGSKPFIVFNLRMLNEALQRRMRNHVARFLFVSLCIRLYRYRYINLINLFGILFRNFHHQELFSLNLDLVYGGIRRRHRNCHFHCYASWTNGHLTRLMPAAASLPQFLLSCWSPLHRKNSGCRSVPVPWKLQDWKAHTDGASYFPIARGCLCSLTKP